jgi:ABC-type multidrug transport system fused ATPase/permease subunit
MQFQTPQFIEVENKIVGPLSLKQFFFLAAGGGISFILFFILAFWLWIIVTIIIGSAAIALAFIKYNGRPLYQIAWIALGFLWKPRLYLWQREQKERDIVFPSVSAETERKNLQNFFSGVPSVKKLWQDLMTTKQPIPKREKEIKNPNWGTKPKEKFELFRKITGEKEAARRVDYR